MDISNFKRLYEGVIKYESEIWLIHNEGVDRTLATLEENSDYDLFVTWFDLADLVGHLHVARRPKKLLKLILN